MAGRLVRRVAVWLIPKNAVLPVLQGPLRGARWVVGSGNLGCWLGTYERDKQTLFSTFIKSGDVVFDIGAHVGFYTLLASRLVGEGGRVVAFEPSLENANTLRRHAALNRCSNVTVVNAAVTRTTGTAPFRVGENSYQGKLVANGAAGVAVPTIGLDSGVASGDLPVPTAMKIDIEGEETQALLGMRETLARYHPSLLLALHNDESRTQCFRILRECGYRIAPIGGPGLDAADEIVATGAVESETGRA
jgi:FkbM family methyltransferase